MNSDVYSAKTLQAPLRTIFVRRAAGDSRRGWLTFESHVIPVALGRGGIKANKREGDGGTPKGVFHPRRLWWRADRFPAPQTFLPRQAIRPDDAWCEDPSSRHYNRPWRLKGDRPGDRLRRQDRMTQQREHLDVVDQLRTTRNLQPTQYRRDRLRVQLVRTSPSRPTDIAQLNARVNRISRWS